MCVNVCDGDVSLVDDDDDERKQLVRTSAEKKWADHMDSAEAWDFLPRDAGGGVLLVGKADARTFEAERNGTLARWHLSLIHI